MAGVVFHAGAEAGFVQHFHIVAGALFQSLGFEHFALLAEFVHALAHFGGDVDEGGVQFFPAGDEVFGGIDGEALALVEDFAGEGIQGEDAFHFVAEELYADGEFLVGGHNFEGVAPHGEAAPGEVGVVALVLHINELAEEGAAVVFFADLNVGDHFEVVGRVAEAVDAGDGGDDEGVAPGQQGGGGGQAEFVQFLIDAAVLFDVGVAARDVSFRLVVIVVGDEVLHGVVGEELPELGGQLGGQGFVVGDDDGGALHFLDDVGHSEGFAAAGDAEEGLAVEALADAGGEAAHGGFLVAHHTEIGHELEIRHSSSSKSLVKIPGQNP